MLLVKTYLHQTPAKGIGLFAADPIAGGAVIFRDDETFDKVYSVAEVAVMPLHVQQFIYCYATFDSKRSAWYLDCDNARFINHSENPNTHYDPQRGEIIALKKISAGEEITSDYREFCDECKGGHFDFEFREE